MRALCLPINAVCLQFLCSSARCARSTRFKSFFIKYNKIGELWEIKCEQLEEELMNTKNAVKQIKGLNEDSFEVTEELKEEIMFLQISTCLRKKGYTNLIGE